ncbi:unnamed protein product, partial [Polarella glacialis]
VLRPLAVGPVHRLPLGEVDASSAGEQLELEVTLVDANHVPGSVMFVFSGYFGNVLYTGDFRLHKDHAHLGAMPLLQRQGGQLARIFLDNTFCHPSFQQPTREEVAKELLKSLSCKWPALIFIAVYKLGKEPLL